MKPCLLSRRTVVTGIFLGLWLVASTAHADAGTSLMWLGVGHLVFGNLIIGVGEGLLAARWMKLRTLRTVGFFILANYLSMIAGLCLLTALNERLQDSFPKAVLVYGGVLLILLGFLSWLLSVVIEWPFCLWAIRKAEHRICRATILSLVVQTASYAILVPVYRSASTISLYTNGRMLPDTSFTANPKAELYYVETATRDIWSTHLDGSGKYRIAEHVVPDRFSSLFLKPAVATAKAELWVGHGIDAAKLLDGVEASASVVRRSSLTESYGMWRLLDLRSEDQRAWTVTGFGGWPVPGFGVQGPESEYRLALETPFLSAWWRNVTILPNDEAVAELNDAIVLVHLPSRRVGFLTKGEAPVVVSIPESP